MTHDGMKTWTDAELIDEVESCVGVNWENCHDELLMIIKPLSLSAWCSAQSYQHSRFGRCVIATFDAHTSKRYTRIACEHDPRGKKAPQPPPPPPNETTTKGDSPAPRPAFADLEEMKACDEFVGDQGKVMAQELDKVLQFLGRPTIRVRGASWFWPWRLLCNSRPRWVLLWFPLFYDWRGSSLSCFGAWPTNAQRRFLRDWPHIVRAVDKYIKKNTKESWAGVEVALQQQGRKALLAEFIKAPKK